MNQTEILKYLEGQKTTRTITDLIVHCTATKPGAKVNVDVIDGWHKERGFKKQPQSGRICGYHFVVLPNGTIETGRYLSEIGAHVSGQNSRSIGICYVGGLDAVVPRVGAWIETNIALTKTNGISATVIIAFKCSKFCNIF